MRPAFILSHRLAATDTKSWVEPTTQHILPRLRKRGGEGVFGRAGEGESHDGVRATGSVVFAVGFVVALRPADIRTRVVRLIVTPNRRRRTGDGYDVALMGIFRESLCRARPAGTADPSRCRPILISRLDRCRVDDAGKHVEVAAVRQEVHILRPSPRHPNLHRLGACLLFPTPATNPGIPGVGM
jgi:hypothetical protein